MNALDWKARAKDITRENTPPYLPLLKHPSYQFYNPTIQVYKNHP
jgi:hypothetical protein